MPHSDKRVISTFTDLYASFGVLSRLLKQTMGRTAASKGIPPAVNRKDARAKRAKQTLNKDIPAVLQAHPRARKGIESSELIVDPPPAATGINAQGRSVAKVEVEVKTDAQVGSDTPDKATPATVGAVKLILRVADTLEAAADLHRGDRGRKPQNVAVLNMASPLRAGGGFLNGATSQEESLCMRSTLYPALKEEFYRLPEVGGVWTPDVLVFRSHYDGTPDLPKKERFFVDVITSAMLRFPDVEEDADGIKHFTNQQDRETTERKIRAVLRIAQSKDVKQLVLGAWGCGAFASPVNEVAKAWKKVLLYNEQDSSKSRIKKTVSASDSWSGMRIVFAIREKAMATAFAQHFGEGLNFEEEGEIASAADDANLENSDIIEVQSKISELEAQIASSKSGMLRERLQAIMDKLKEDG